MAITIWIAIGSTVANHFSELALGLQAAFIELGEPARIVRDPTEFADTTIVLGPEVTRFELPADKRIIIFNLEQVFAGSRWFNEKYVELLKRHPVWDYSLNNIAELARMGISAIHCGIGYVPELTRIKPETEDIDVLFVGFRNARRMAVLQEIAKRGARTMVVYDHFGEKRDSFIARAKIVVNIHFYEARIFEIVRVSYLLANRKCVVSEVGLDHAIEAPLARGVAFVPYGEIAETCMRLLGDDAERKALAQAGFECFSRQKQADYLRRALAQTPV
jgi:hypothetical protein